MGARWSRFDSEIDEREESQLRGCVNSSLESDDAKEIPQMEEPGITTAKSGILERTVAF